ncbi:conserved hypothetical protein [Magnetococcus marinus MC-1]|uniref:DUF3301 domain-containing protein n=1 Tax=Magnetococcus marinus (strain ATCC BAA-1437 / JCM 17883 / MC-1) TaxID=156889 RepID=A0L7F7_MAGMM|nr:DUF3301 domain-containing protein [Magnetococcus marinus]ABK43900.1 conserved hypothetical protein [Magnetococcus marinus MC-1]
MSDPTLWLLCTALVGLLWYYQMQARERAVRTAYQVCQEMGASLLDGAAYLTSMRLERHPQRLALQIRRVYGFRYSLGDGLSHEGVIIQVGEQLQQVMLQPHAEDSLPPTFPCS